MPPQRSFLLGDLEQAVMDRLWTAGPQDVKACHLAIGRNLSATTVVLSGGVVRGRARARPARKSVATPGFPERWPWTCPAIPRPWTWH